MHKFTDLDIQSHIASTSPKWNFNGKDIVREYTFNTYLNSIEFVNAIGIVAEAMNHHPVIQISWGKVLVQVHTHSVDGISLLDFKLAARLDKFYLLHYDL